MKAILFKNGVEFKRGRYPKKNISAIENLSNDLEWKLIIEDPVPSVDRRIYNITPIEANTDDFNSEYPHLKEYRVTWDVTPKSKISIIDKVNKIYAEKNKSIIGEEDKDAILLVGIASVVKELRGEGSIEPIEDTVRDILISKGINVVNNYFNKLDLIDKINNDEPYDIDSGWFDSE